MNPFNADYYVDKLSAWCALPAYHKVLIIGICGFNEKVYNNLIKLLSHEHSTMITTRETRR